jgi:hypothetical protein
VETVRKNGRSEGRGKECRERERRGGGKDEERSERRRMKVREERMGLYVMARTIERGGVREEVGEKDIRRDQRKEEKREVRKEDKKGNNRMGRRGNMERSREMREQKWSETNESEDRLID